MAKKKTLKTPYKIVVASALKDNAGRLHCEDGPALILCETPEDLNNPEVNWNFDNITPEQITSGVKQGFKAFYHHNIIIPPPPICKERGLPKEILDYFYFNKDKLTAQFIQSIPNMELRRIGIEKLGIQKFMEQANTVVLHEDLDPDGRPRKLVQMILDPTRDENAEGNKLLGVFVKNGSANGTFEVTKKTLKPLKEFDDRERNAVIAKYRNTGLLKTVDGELFLEVTIESGDFIPDRDENGNLVYKDYFIQVHPELRPLINTGRLDRDGDPILELGEPQELTCHNAIASTFGLYGDEYIIDVET